MENSTCIDQKGNPSMIYRNNDILIYPNIWLAAYLLRQISGGFCWKDYRKDIQSAVSSPKVNLCRPVGSKFIFLQCKKPSPYPLRSGEGWMLPMVAVRKLGEVRP